jgi:hypothetical protein
LASWGGLGCCILCFILIGERTSQRLGML